VPLHKEHSVTPDNVRIVQETFELVAPAADAVATLFYDRLFTLARVRS
jgi:hypothetical protein